MGETQEIIHRQSGFTWKLNIKKMTRTPKEGSKYDDVTEVEAELIGNTVTFVEAQDALDDALEKLKAVLHGV